MSMIRKIKRNKSEMAVGFRCNRYGKQQTSRSFRSFGDSIPAFFENLFFLDEYLKHRVNLSAVGRLIQQDRNDAEDLVVKPKLSFRKT